MALRLAAFLRFGGVRQIFRLFRRGLTVDLFAILAVAADSVARFRRPVGILILALVILAFGTSPSASVVED